MTKNNERKDCRLCGLVKKILEEPAVPKVWKNEIAIEDNKGALKAMTLRGTKYSYSDGSSEIVRALYDNTLFVNPIKDYSNVYSDIVIAIPFLHANNDEFINNYRVQFSLFMQDVYEFLKKEYCGIGARIMVNDGKVASINFHLHAQILQVRRTETMIPEIIRDY